MAKLFSQIDHLVVTAPSLRVGTEYLHDMLGFIPQPGGEHPEMGTHNALLRVGLTTYIEVLAVNPKGKGPVGRRWFEIDQSDSTEPQLRAWVVHTTDIRAVAKSATVNLGPIKQMSRDSFEWLITIPKNGKIPLDGVGPALIQWTTDAYPAASLTPSGCKLSKLVLQHPQPNEVKALLDSIGFREQGVEVKLTEGAPCLIMTIETPQRTVVMHSLRKPHLNTINLRQK